MRRAFTESGFKELKVVQNNPRNVGTRTVTMPTPLLDTPVKSEIIIRFKDFQIEGLTVKDITEILPLVLKLESA